MQKALKYTSPFGKAIYPHLSKCDVRFKAEGEYHVDLELSDEEAQEMELLINHLAEDSVKLAQEETSKKVIKRAPLPMKKEDGKTIFKFKMKASGVNKRTGDKFQQRPALFDSELNPINPEETNIWGGSIIRVSYVPSLWYTPMLGAGVSLRLKSVQVKTLVEGGNQSVEHGFDKVEGDIISNENSQTDKGSNEEAMAHPADF